MNLRSQIESLVLQLTGHENVYESPSFYYGREHEANVFADDVKFPLVVLIEPDQMGFNVNTTTGTIRDTYNVFIQFIDRKEDISQDANYRHETVEAMRTMAADFLRLLSNSDYFFDVNPNVNGVLLVDYYDANTQGIEINLTQLTDIYTRPC